MSNDPLIERAIDEAPIGITIADARRPDNPLIYVNDAFERLTRYPREETLSVNCRFLQGENTKEEPVAAMREAIANEESVSVELRNYRRNGVLEQGRHRPVTRGRGGNALRRPPDGRDGSKGGRVRDPPPDRGNCPRAATT